MSTNYHTPIAEGADANASTFNSPLSELDSELTTLANTVPDDISARVALSSDQTINNTTQTALSFGAETYDTDTMWASSPNPERLTVNTAGKYVFTAQVEWLGSTSGYRQVIIRLNGSTELVRITQEPVINLPFSMIASIIDEFSDGDYLEVLVWQNTGGTLDVNSTDTAFTCQLLSV